MELPETRVVLFEKYLGEDLLSQYFIEQLFWIKIQGYNMEEIVLRAHDYNSKKHTFFLIKNRVGNS